MIRAEQDLQIAVVQYLRLAAPQLLFWHVPNGGKREKREASLLKAMGVLPGVPDLAMILPGGVAGFIELKSGAGRESVEQEAFRDAVNHRGGVYACCNTINAVEKVLRLWGVPLKARAA